MLLSSLCLEASEIFDQGHRIELVSGRIDCHGGATMVSCEQEDEQVENKLVAGLARRHTASGILTNCRLRSGSAP